MAKKKKESKSEKKVVNKQAPKLYSLENLAEAFGYSVYQMMSLYSIRGIDVEQELSIEEAEKLFKDVMI